MIAHKVSESPPNLMPTRQAVLRGEDLWNVITLRLCCDAGVRVSEDEVPGDGGRGAVRSCGCGQSAGDCAAVHVLQGLHSLWELKQTWLELPLPAAAGELAAPCRRLGAAFYRLCLQQNEGGQAAGKGGKLQMKNFAQGGGQVLAQCARASSQAICRAMFCLFAADDKANAMTEHELSQLLFVCLVMAEDGEVEEVDPAADVAKALARAAMPPSAGSTQVSSDDFVRWIGAQVPLLYTIFMSWMVRKCFESLTKPSFEAPRLSHKSSILSRYDNKNAGSRPFRNTHLHWDLAVFGMFCDTEWKESSRYYGGNGCFLFRMAPEINMYRVSASGANENYMYLNSKGFALPRGLGMGGSPDKFRLFLSEDLDEHSYTTPKCLSFEAGRLSSSEQFVIDAMEVWGCGGEASELSQKAHRQETADLINRARKVDKAQFVGSDFDKEMFLGKTFGHGTDKARMADDEQ
ncbi:unnamed protein product [Phytophthora lilii]|uniref:Unnamed protein product n=1 Tax=Phytophthora lilii TaxID=2077276 RepID=A0A9W6T7X3_9STRA|nr:unnamed protein product [Phytophthora lilii]